MTSTKRLVCEGQDREVTDVMRMVIGLLLERTDWPKSHVCDFSEEIR